MPKRNKSHGFAMVEVLIVLMLLMILSAAILSAVSSVQRRTALRAWRNKAEYAAVAAVQMLADEVAENPKSDTSKLILKGVGGAGLSLASSAGKEAAITYSSAQVKSGQETYLRITATATAGSQTETASVTMINQRALAIPSTVYGAGLSTNLLQREDATQLVLGEDTDLMYSAENGRGFIGQQSDLNGKIQPNLIVGGNFVRLNKPTASSRIENASVGGMVLCNGRIELNNVIVGNPEAGTAAQKRMGGIFCVEDLVLENCEVYGNIWADNVVLSGDSALAGGNAYYVKDSSYFIPGPVWAWDSAQNLWEERLTSAPKGALRFKTPGKGWKKVSALPRNFLLNSDSITAGFSGVFSPTWPESKQPVQAMPSYGELKGAGEYTVYKVAKNGFSTPDRITPGCADGLAIEVEEGATLYLADPVEPYVLPDGTKVPAVFIKMNPGSILKVFTPGPFYICVYGEDYTVEMKDCEIYGTVTNALETQLEGERVTIHAVQPANEAFQTPVSAGTLQDQWVPISYESGK